MQARFYCDQQDQSPPRLMGYDDSRSYYSRDSQSIDDQQSWQSCTKKAVGREIVERLICFVEETFEKRLGKVEALVKKNKKNLKVAQKRFQEAHNTVQIIQRQSRTKGQPGLSEDIKGFFDEIRRSKSPLQTLEIHSKPKTTPIGRAIRGKTPIVTRPVPTSRSKSRPRQSIPRNPKAHGGDKTPISQKKSVGKNKVKGWERLYNLAVDKSKSKRKESLSRSPLPFKKRSSSKSKRIVPLRQSRVLAPKAENHPIVQNSKKPPAPRLSYDHSKPKEAEKSMSRQIIYHESSESERDDGDEPDSLPFCQLRRNLTFESRNSNYGSLSNEEPTGEDLSKARNHLGPMFKEMRTEANNNEAKRKGIIKETFEDKNQHFGLDDSIDAENPEKTLPLLQPPESYPHIGLKKTSQSKNHQEMSCDQETERLMEDDLDFILEDSFAERKPLQKEQKLQDKQHHDTSGIIERDIWKEIENERQEVVRMLEDVMKTGASSFKDTGDTERKASMAENIFKMYSTDRSDKSTDVIFI